MPDHEKKIEHVAALAIVALLVIGSVIIVLPFLRAILWALVFAVSLWPLFERVEKRLGGRIRLAAMIPTLIIAVLFFMPSIYVGSRLVVEGSNALDFVKELMEKGTGPPPLWLENVPLVGERLEGAWRTVQHDTPGAIEVVKPHVRNLMGSMVTAGAGMARIVLTAILSLLLLFFLLKDGRPLKTSLERMAERLGGERGLHLLFVAGSTMRSVVFGILGAAVVQGILAIFGLWISGVPNPVFTGTAAGLFALVPIGLIQLVLLPAAGWLIYSGATGWGIFLFIWSLFVVGNIDNVIRPMLISRGANLPFLVVLLGVLGGLAFGGIVGLFVGATFLAVFYTMLKEWVAVPGSSNRAGGGQKDNRVSGEERQTQCSGFRVQDERIEESLLSSER